MVYPKSKVSIVIAAKDEGEGLKQVIESVKPYASEIILVDGHSKDKTREIAQRENIKYILDHGLGRGAAVRLGIDIARNEIVVLFDADGSHEAKDIPKLVFRILKKQADLVICSRRTGGSFDLNPGFSGIIRSGGADLLAFLVNQKFKTNFSDIIYSFRAIRKKTAKKLNLKSNGFTIEQEMVVSCLKKGLKVIEIPSREEKRAWGKSKLKTLTGLKLLFSLLKQLYLQI